MDFGAITAADAAMWLLEFLSWLHTNLRSVSFAIFMAWLTWRCLRRKDESKKKLSRSRGRAVPGALDLSDSEGNGEKGHLVLVNAAPCGPPGAVFQSNAPEPCPFETDISSGNYLFIHRPTDDPERVESGDYPYGDHMHGRRRLWEFRMQFRFKRKVEGEVFFGVEQDRYYPVSMVERYLVSSFVSLIRRAAPGMYHSHGDDPVTTDGECEIPGTVFPLWVMDQLIVTPEGETPPRLNDPEFDTFGRIKAHDREAMKQAIDGLDFSPGKTYTFGFWCVAQFMDAIAWKLLAAGILPETSLTDLSTHPPCFATMYCLKPKDQWRSVSGPRDNRHLVSRKTYLWRVGFWSSHLPPPPGRTKELMCTGEPGTPSSRGQRSRSRDDRSCGFCGIRW
eukprot:TRINITY_DN73017_c0_g1_i1.p1 TRINITY_DN73017_c0_g1~~TRINITY_DN73017_c0_g1_i1.p1  ORF type:complete len:415 (-),score=65.56 TRINITY_DN73017_c0_g1_i1:76-1251(-)